MPAPTPALINGTGGTATVKINALDYQCVLGAWRGSANKRFFEQQIFCAGGWVNELAGLKQVVGSSTGYLSSGDPISDPLLDFSEADGVPFVLQADTGCSIAFTGHIEKDFGVVAGANSEFGVRFRSKGAVSSTWILA